MTFPKLCQRNGIPHQMIQKPTDPKLQQWLRNQKIDVLVILTSHILTEPLLSIPRLGVLNKHAALLPAYRGLFPYVWALIDGAAQGVTIHLVDEGIDTGETVCRANISGKPTDSMAAFYAHVDFLFPDLLVEAISKLQRGAPTLGPPPNLQSSYKGKPTRQDYLRFRKAGGKITRLRDVFRALCWG